MITIANVNANQLEVLLVEPDKSAKICLIDGSLSGLQKAVGGDIEAAYFFDDPVALICQEEGKLNGAPLNRAVRDEDGHIIDIIAGRFIICGLSADSFASLPAPMQQKYMDMFRRPEAFLRIGDRIATVAMDNDKLHKRHKEEPR